MDKFATSLRREEYTDKFIVLFLVLSVLTMRPSFLGEIYTTLSIAFSSIAFAIRLSKREKFYIKRNYVALFYLILLFFIYLLVHSWLLGNPALLIVLKTCFTSCFLIFIFVFCLSDSLINYLFFKSIWLILLFLSFSYVLSFSLIFFANFSFDTLFLFSISYNYFVDVSLLIPFTFIFGSLNFNDIQLIRNTGFFREAGICSAFLIWAIWWTWFNKRKVVYLLILFLGLLGTISTSGIMIFVITLFIFFIKKSESGSSALISRLVFFPLAIFFSYIILYKFPVLGINDKSETHGSSIDYRFNSVDNAFANIINNPFGVGLYSPSFDGASVNFISATQFIGVVGFIFIILIFFLRYFTNKYENKYFLLLILPFFILGLLSQPIIDSPLIYIYLYQNFTGKFKL